MGRDLLGQEGAQNSVTEESLEGVQEYVLRIIAFEDETSIQFKLDLNF